MERRVFGFRAPAAVPLAAMWLGCTGEPTSPVPDAACRGGSLQLAVGEARELPPRDGCVVLDGGAARYALAVFDPIQLVEAENVGFSSSVWRDSFDITVGLGAVTGLGAQRVFRAGPAASLSPFEPGRASGASPPHVVHSVVGGGRTCPHGDVDSDPVLCRDRPWTLGERFNAPQARPADVLPLPMEVVAIQGPVVFAMRPAQIPGFGASVSADLAAFEPILTETTDFLAATFGVDHPTTSPEAGQLLVMIIEANVSLGGAGNRVLGFTDETSYRTYAEIQYNTRNQEPGQPAAVIIHEIAHTWQGEYRWTREDLPSPQWAVEGGADLVGYRWKRLQAGVAFDANLDADAASDPDVVTYLRTMRFSSGNISRGYTESASFLTHLFGRARARGLAEADIYRTLLTRSLEDWYGAVTIGGASLGFVHHWGALLGVEWDPGREALEYGLAVAADDLLASDRFTWPPVRDAWRPSIGSDFKPLAAIARGESISARRPGGAVGYIYVDDSGSGGELRRTSTRPGVRWMILRLE